MLANGIHVAHLSFIAPYNIIPRTRTNLALSLIPGLWPNRPPGAAASLTFRAKGISITSSWATPADALSNKIELDNTIAQGLKAEISSQFKPAKGPGAQKLNLFFKQPMFHTRAFFDLVPGGNVQAVVDGVMSHEGFMVGGEVGYDVQKAALSRYSAALGYATPSITAAVTATNNLSIFTASYYQKVNAAVEVGTKAAYDVKSSSTVGLEVASKYKIDPMSFAKVCIGEYNCRVSEHSLIPKFIGQDQRPRYRIHRLQHQGQPWLHTRHWRFVRHSEAQRERPQGLYTFAHDFESPYANSIQIGANFVFEA